MHFLFILCTGIERVISIVAQLSVPFFTDKTLFIKHFKNTMSAKSLGTLAMIYVTDVLQHPLHHYTMLSKADMNNLASRSDARAHSYAFPLSNQHCMKGGGGFTVELLSLERERSRKFLKMQGCSK